MDYQTLEIQQEPRIATVWLNRPDVRNAFNQTTIAELVTLAPGATASAEHRAAGPWLPCLRETLTQRGTQTWRGRRFRARMPPAARRCA